MKAKIEALIKRYREMETEHLETIKKPINAPHYKDALSAQLSVLNDVLFSLEKILKEWTQAESKLFTNPNGNNVAW